MSLCILVLAAFAVQIILKILLADSYSYVNTLISQILVVFLPTLIYLIGTEKRVGQYLKIYNNHLALDVIFAIATAISANILCQYINYPIIRILGFSHAAESMNQSAYEFFINLIVLCVIPAILEELLFRGVILGELTTKYSYTKATVVTAIIFSLLHLDAGNILPQFILGIFLCRMALSVKSVLIPIVAHFSNNLFAVLLKEQMILFFSKHGIVIFLSSLVIATFGVVYFNFRRLRREI